MNNEQNVRRLIKLATTIPVKEYEKIIAMIEQGVDLADIENRYKK